MVDKIYMLERRIEELKDLIYKARNGYAINNSEVQWLESMLVLNNRIITHLKNGYPIVFYPVQYNDENAKGFFLTKRDIAEPFISVAN